MVSTRSSTPTPSRKRSTKSLKSTAESQNGTTSAAATPSKSPSTKGKKRSSSSSSSAATAAANASSTSSSPATKATSPSSPSPATPTPKPKRNTRSASKATMRKTGTFPVEDERLLAPRSEHFEFGGPVGAFFVSTTVPFFTYAFFFYCNEEVGCALPPKSWTLPLHNMAQGVVNGLTDTQAWIIYLSWYTFCVAAWALIPCQEVEGTELRTGGKLLYQINALRTMLLALAVTAGLIITQGPASATFLYDHWVGLIGVSLIVAFTQATFVYVRSFEKGRLLAKGGNTGNHIYDWFIGRELNPRIGAFDLKYFNELRPGLILWVLLDISAMCHQYVSLGRVTDSIVLVTGFHFIYVVDALYNEASILSTMDITTDGNGWMLEVGDLTWVPFVYSLQARIIAFSPVDLGLFASAAIVGLNGLGYWIFRSSNSTKHNFRQGKNLDKVKYMTTSSGRKLITSGWWGMCRHPNYLGDLLMGLAWSLPCGFSHPLAYTYPAYFLVLLVHRQMRDDEACKEKYGKDWDKYCSLVPSRIFPGIY